MLSPALVGDIAHETPAFDQLTEDEAHALVRHTLAYAACAAADATSQSLAPAVEPLLRQAARAQSLRSISVAATATRTTAMLADAGVRSLVYKGPPLAVQTTGTWLGRGSADVDVLIDPSDRDITDRALRAAGCESRAGYSGPPSRWERYHRPERAYRGLPVTIDLHWRVDPGPGYYSARFDDLWERREHIVCDGLDVHTFDRVDALLATAVHGAKERWSRWSWPLDAVRQVEALEEGAWPEVRIRASRTGATKAVHLCIAVAAVCGARLPRGLVPSKAMLEIANVWVRSAAESGTVEWSTSASLFRRKARWLMADSHVVAADGFARAVARLVTDRRPPWVPQKGTRR